MERISSATVSFNFLGTLASTFLTTWTWQCWTLAWINLAGGFLMREAWIVLDEMDLMWIPVKPSWRLNERHYGALQGLNKALLGISMHKDPGQ
jgi:hypothetical protein